MHNWLVFEYTSLSTNTKDDGMKRSVRLWQLFGFAFVSFLGTVLHFLYDWLGKPVWIAPFSGVNESTWEHMKLLFWPMVIYAVVQGIFFKAYDGFWCIKVRGILLGLALIPIMFYTYNGAIGKSPDWINIAIFFISAAVVYVYETIALKGNAGCKYPKAAVLILLVVAVMFIVFTFTTPQIAIFRDPITGGYGA